MSTIAEKLTQIAENTQRVYNAGYEKGIREGDGCDHNILPIVEIVPNFANGDFTESLPDNYYAHAAKILKPVNLKPENIAKDVNIAGVIGTHEGGGGSVDGTATVTFCNYDGTELYSRLVFIGDDCPDPIAQGKLDTPIRDSDVQYHYTFNGWSATQGGTASSTALKNITADKTVYAAYSTSLVYYTVRFYDGDTLMQESKVAYGGTATAPDAKKEGHIFNGWTPSDLTIYGDTDFYGNWALTQGYILGSALSAINNTYEKICCCFSRDGQYFAVVSKTTSNQIYVFNTSNWSLAKTLTCSSQSVKDCIFSPDSKYLAVATSKGVNIYKTSNWDLYWSMGTTNLNSVAFADDSATLFFTYYNSTSLEYCDVPSKTPIRSISTTQNSYARMSGNIIVVVSKFGYAPKCYKYTEDKTLAEITLPDADGMKSVYASAINESGTKIFMQSLDGTDARIYTVNKDTLTATYEKLPFTFDGTQSAIVDFRTAAFAPNANILAVPGSSGGTLINLDKNELYYEPDVKPTRTTIACAYSSDGSKFAMCGYNNSADSYKGVYIYNTIRTE